MKLILQLSEEDVRKLIASKVSNECSKHGHPDSISKKVVVHLRCAGDEILEMPLEDLGVSINAEVEIS